MKRLVFLLGILSSNALAIPSGGEISDLNSGNSHALVLTLDSGVTIRGRVAPSTLPCLTSAWQQARRGAGSATVSLFRSGGASVRVDLRHVKALNVPVSKPAGACPANLLIVSDGQ